MKKHQSEEFGENSRESDRGFLYDRGVRIIMQNENAAPEARILNVVRDEEFHNLAPSWTGREVIVYHMTRKAIEQGKVMPFFPPAAGSQLDLSNYEAVVKVAFDWVHEVPSPFMVTQNAFDSWSKDRVDEPQEGYTMFLMKPLVDGWGHRSTSVGDILHDLSTDRFYVVDNCGFTRLVCDGERKEFLAFIEAMSQH